MNIHDEARELNAIIANANPHAANMLSKRGKAIYFPRKGIISQAAEARGKMLDATIGTALEDDGSPMCLEAIVEQFSARPKEFFSYAPSYGNPRIRSLWKEMILRKNPSLAGIPVSLPVVTCALTHGLYVAGYVFVDEDETVVAPDLYWENYSLIFGVGCGAVIKTYPAFINDGFNVEGLRRMLAEKGAGKKIVLLNFPNNPTGYTVTLQEAQRIKDVLVETADAGSDIVAIIDDAYFGLVYEEGIMRESIFSMLAGAHERICAIKLDGPTKEDYVWGFRVGFIMFGMKGATPELYRALEAKTGGAVRATVSNASNLSQGLLVNAYGHHEYEKQQREKYEVLRRRYMRIRDLFSTHPEYAEVMQALPFNSGYFMCVRICSGDAEAVRRLLLDKYSTGIIAQDDIIRIAFSSTPHDQLDMLFNNIFQAARDAGGHP